MGTAVRAWRRFWFPDVPERRLAILRIAVAIFCAVELLFFARFLPRYGDVDLEFADPVYLLRPIMAVRPDAATMGVLQVVAIVAFAMVALGWKTRWALAVAAPLYTYAYALFNSFYKVNHGKIPLIVILWVLLLAPAGAAYSLDALRRRSRNAGTCGPLPKPGDGSSPFAGWALRVVAVSIVIAYSMSVIGKLRTTGIGWVTEPVLQSALMTRTGDLSALLQPHTELLIALQAGTLVLEALSPLLLLGGRVRDLLLIAFGSFHLGSGILLGVEFLGFFVAYLAFYRTEVAADRVGRWVKARTGEPRLRLTAPDADRRARRAAVILDAMDWTGHLQVEAGGRPVGAAGRDDVRLLTRTVPLLRLLWPLMGLPFAADWASRRLGSLQVAVATSPIVAARTHPLAS